MSNDNIQHLFSKMRNEKLSSFERAEIQKRLVAFIRRQPVPTYKEFSFMKFMWISEVRRVTVGVLAVLVAIFGGVSYAAEGSLPGDTLYALKTKLNEPVRSALAVSEKAKVGLEAELADRRLYEASMLAREDRLDEGLQEELLRQAAEHATLLRARLDKTSSNFDESEIIELTSRLEASRDARNALTARVVPIPVMALRVASSESEAEPTQATTMMVVATPSVVQEDPPVKLKGGEPASEDNRSQSEIQLRRVEEEYEKALSILGAEIGKFSKEKERRIRDRRTEQNEKPNDTSQGEVRGSSVEVIMPTTDDSPENPGDNGLLDRRRGADKLED